MVLEAHPQPGPMRRGPQPRLAGAAADDHPDRRPPPVPQRGQRGEHPFGSLLRREPGAVQHQQLVAVGVSGAQGRVVPVGVEVGEIDAERHPHHVARPDPVELAGRPGGCADHPVVSGGGGRVEPVGQSVDPGPVTGRKPEQAVEGFVGDHQRGDPVPARPPAGPAQGGPVGDLQPVGGQLAQQPAQPDPVEQDPVSPDAGHHRTGQGDHPALLALLVPGHRPRNHQHRLVPGGPVAPAQLPQRGAQPAGAVGDEIGQSDDPHEPLSVRRPGAGAGSAALSAHMPVTMPSRVLPPGHATMTRGQTADDQQPSGPPGSARAERQPVG